MGVVMAPRPERRDADTLVGVYVGSNCANGDTTDVGHA